MSLELNFNERRVLGTLIEKSLATPEQYPLTLNALVNGCNQKSCRDPMSYLLEDEVLDTVETLRQKQLVAIARSMGGRTDRYKHRLMDTLAIEGRRAAVLAELLLRGPQTDGELRQRASRLVNIPTLEDLGTVVAELEDHRGVAYVTRLGDGRRGSKYAHTLYPANERPDDLDATRSHRPTEPTTSTSPSAPRPTSSSPAVATTYTSAGTSAVASGSSGSSAASSEELQSLRARVKKLEEQVEELESTFMRFFQ